MMATLAVIIAAVAGTTTISTGITKAVRWLLERRMQFTAESALEGQPAPVIISNYEGLAAHAHLKLSIRLEQDERRRHTRRAELILGSPRWGILKRTLARVPLTLEDGSALDRRVEGNGVHEFIVRGEVIRTHIPLRWDVQAWVALHMAGELFPLIRQVDVKYLQDMRYLARNH